MKVLAVEVHPGSRQPKLKKGKDVWQVWLRGKPQQGRANGELITFIAEYLGISRSRILLLKGYTSRYKQVGIIDE